MIFYYFTIIPTEILMESSRSHRRKRRREKEKQTILIVFVYILYLAVFFLIDCLDILITSEAALFFLFDDIND